MSGCKGLVSNLDNFSAPPEGPKTFVGGVVSIITYILVVLMLIIYCVTVSEKQYPREVSVVAFPNDPGNSILMPPMKCVATSGCYVRTSGTPSTCTFVSQGTAFPDSIRTLYYTSDAYEYFNVLSTDSSENFAISYDVEEVTSYSNPLETSTLKAASDFSMSTPMPYKMFKGIAIFNLIRTVGIDKTVDTWGHSTTSTTSIYEAGEIGATCCGATILDIDGNILYSQGAGPIGSCSSNDGKWCTSIQAATTYTEVTVIDPLDFATMTGLVGGWLGIMATVGVILFMSYSKIFGEPEPYNFAANKENNIEMTRA
jgi:hypothetical protein